MHFLTEAVIMGIMVAIIGNLTPIFIGKRFSVDLPDICNTWNKYYVMEISLFMTGFIAHVLFELSGVNGWYCKHGHACSIA